MPMKRIVGWGFVAMLCALVSSEFRAESPGTGAKMSRRLALSSTLRNKVRRRVQTSDDC